MPEDKLANKPKEVHRKMILERKEKMITLRRNRNGGLNAKDWNGIPKEKEEQCNVRRRERGKKRREKK